ncbi:MAG: twin transmembrane helix small protein [Gammaproteobacteria bacterium]
MKVIIAVLLLGVVASLGQALFAMSSGPDTSGRMVRALTWRISLSLALFAVLMLGWYFGLIEPLDNR